MISWAEMIAGNLFIACLIGGLAWFVGRTGHRSRLAHTLWLVFFVKLITPPIVAIPFEVPERWWPAAAIVSNGRPSDRDPGGLFDTSAAAGVTVVQPTEVAEPTHEPAASQGRVTPDPFAQCLVVGWAVGFIWIVSRGLIRLIRFHRLLQRNGTEDPEATRFVGKLLRSEKAAGSKHRRRGPQVLRIPLRVSPMLFGLGRRPVIVCPDQLWKSLSEGERHAFLAHETAHYYRRDHWVRWVEWIVTAAYWWFPVVYFARRQLERHEEACCDAWAVRKLDAPPRQYAEALLRVIDFISEYRVGVPRFASAMQPTHSLEERLHRVMKGSCSDGDCWSMRWSVGAACLTLWLVHPILQPYQKPAVAVGPSAGQSGHDSLASILPETLSASSGSADDPADLPEPPQGFWNRTARRQWADFSLTLPGGRLIAEANRGIRFDAPGRAPLYFSSQELSAVVEIPSTQRVVIGDSAGRLRLWDLLAGMPVSLVGLHPTSVNSLAYHETMGLASADNAGSVMRWDLQSGQVRATWADAHGPVQTIRYAQDGQTLAILTGRWNQASEMQDVYIVDSGTLQVTNSIMVTPHTAVVFQSSASDWLAVDWAGHVYSLSTRETVGVVSKHQVSSLVLCQDSPLVLGEQSVSALPERISPSAVMNAARN